MRERVKAEVGLPTIAVGLITEPEQAEAIIAKGRGRRRVARPRHAVRPALALARGGRSWART
jgi:2,4-dienoyl-CoA reductase-like NADH-dependent reductase (Old Yellow Enzyme family)